MSGKIIITLDRGLYRRARTRAWWWKTGIGTLAFVILHWQQELASLLFLVGLTAPGVPHLAAGLLLGAIGSKRPGDIDPRFPPER